VREGQVGNPVEKGISLPGLATNTVTAGGGSDVYVVASSAEDVAFVSAYGPPPDKWAPPALPPEIKSQYAVSVDPEGAIVRAQIGPRFWKDTSYYVEYGIGRCSEGGCTSQRPAPPGNLLNAGIVNTIVNTTNVILPGLSPGTTYHYRFVAQSSGGGPVRGVGPEEAEGAFVTPAPPGAPNTDCPNQIFRTGAAAKLVDCRAYEMVSPVEKNNTDIASLINLNSNPATLNQSAAGGEALTYTTAKGFGDAQGAPYVSQYVASRGAGGWRNHGITPPQGLSTNDIGLRLDVDFRAFTPDLCQSVLLRGVDPALAPGAPEGLPEGFFNLYRRTNCGGDSYEALITAKPPTVKYFNPEVQGLSADGRCVIFYAEGQLTPDANPGVAPNGSNRQLYGFCDGQTRLISVLPAGSATTSDTAAGTANPGVRFRTGNDAQAVSADGSRVYWTAAKENPGTVYVRVNAERAQSEVSGGQCTEEEQACTIKVSQTVSGAKAHFWGATADGAKAFFTIEDQTSPLDGNLYEFDLDSRAATLVGTKVVGVMGVGGKAGGTARIYFASSNVLAAGATAGQPNLYLYERTEEGSQTSFIATLSTADLIGKETTSGLSPIKAVPYKKTSRVSPDGRSIAFSSSASLTGYDNVDVSNGEADAEVYTYNAVSGELRCASCNPTGQRPSGRDIESQGAPSGTWMAAQIPPYLNEFYGTRAISDDGSRVFFNSYDDLLPRDTNGKADVYEWERPGSGDCTEASSVFSPPNGGCLSLISSGESPTDSEFVDASADGTDVFFTTASSLLPQDPGLIDIYDARAGGGYPAPPTPPASCEGEACQGPLAPPNDPTPASSAFEGAGNVKAEKKAHKKKKTHKKKKSAKKNAAKKHKRANNKGRAGR
jgi:hypothetical protein